MSYYVIDIETGPQPDHLLDGREPEFKAPSNYKDGKKIAANIEEQRRTWKDKAALDARYGIVLAIGILDPVGNYTIWDAGREQEYEMLGNHWGLWEQTPREVDWYGWNNRSFDWPFLIRRSWAMGVTVPYNAWDYFRGRAGVPERVKDLMAMWELGDNHARASLNSVAMALGVGSKEESNSEFFSVLFEKDRQAGLEHLRNDLRLTEQVGRRMGLIKQVSEVCDE